MFEQLHNNKTITNNDVHFKTNLHISTLLINFFKFNVNIIVLKFLLSSLIDIFYFSSVYAKLNKL